MPCHLPCAVDAEATTRPQNGDAAAAPHGGVTEVTGEAKSFVDAKGITYSQINDLSVDPLDGVRNPVDNAYPYR